MHPLVPGFIQDRYLRGEASGQFLAAGLFLDISGFSTITDTLMAYGQHGAEVMAKVMRSIFDPVITHIFAQGGFVASSAGDSLTALFPLEGEDLDGPMRALAAAWKIQEEIARLGTISTPYQDVRIVARVGLAKGVVQWGIITANTRQGVYYFQGPAIDNSALAQQQARPGEVVLAAPLAVDLGPLIAVDDISDDFVCLARVAEALPGPRPELSLPPVDRRALAQFYPAEVIDLEISGEFRYVVNLLVNLPSVRKESQLRIFMESVFALQEVYGGLIGRLDFGDKGTNLLIFWGVPAANENDIARAVNFILSLQASTSIPISAGMTYRIAHAGFIGGRLYEEYTCSGRGVSLAARFMTTAQRGEIWVDEAIARRAGHSFDIELVGERRFKGFGRPQNVYLLLERKEPDVALFQNSLVGRENDLEELSTFVGPVFSGRYAGLMVISGEPGIGKSRLVHAFLDQLQAGDPESFQVFIGQTDEIVRSPFNPFAYWLRRYFGINEVQGEARSKRSFNRRMDALIAGAENHRLAEELDRTRSFLGALVGLSWADSLYEQLDAQGRYNNTLIALATLLQVESRRMPVVLLLEDIHQLDEESLACLTYLARVLAVQADHDCPAALLCTSRHGPEDLGLAAPGIQGLRLGGLDRASLHALAVTHLGGPPAGSLLDLLETRAEGNPFYAEHILLYLKEESLLEFGVDGWGCERGQPGALPADIHSMLVARLDHLDHGVKEVVQTAAVLGREFDVQLLGCMLENCDPPAQLSEVGSAEREGIWTRLSDTRCLFRHMLMREAAYQMQVHTRRQRLHALALEACERLYAGSLPAHYGELAYHAEQAELVQAARRYLRLAGEATRDAYQNGLAIDYLTRALALAPETDVVERCELLLAREGIYEALGKQSERQRDLELLDALLPALESIPNKVEIMLRQALYEVDMGEYEAADVFAGQALDLAHQSGLAAKESRACYTLATSALRRGRLEQAEASSNEALRLAVESGSVEDEFSASNILGLTETDLGRLDQARQSFTRCLELARRLGRLTFQIAPLNNLANVTRMQGDFASGLAFYEQAVAIARQTGDRSREGMALGNLGFLAGLLGEYPLALRYIEQSLRLNRESGLTLHVAYGLINLSACAGALGDFTAAEDAAREANGLAQALDDRSGEAWALTYLGHSLLARGAFHDAARAYADALAIRRVLGQPDLAAEPAAGLARVSLELGDLSAAHTILEPVLAYLDGGGSLETADEPLRVYLTGFLVLERTGDPRALTMLETAYRLLHERAASIQRQETRQAFLTAIAHHREIQSAWEQRQVR